MSQESSVAFLLVCAALVNDMQEHGSVEKQLFFKKKKEKGLKLVSKHSVSV